MIRYAIDNGVNIIDAGYAYHLGTSESFVGRSLRGGYRDKVKLIAKLPSWNIEKSSDMDAYLNEQLEHLQTNYIDFYMFHALNGTTWSQLKSLKALDWAERMIAKGLIRHIGFSFHDELRAFRKIVDDYDGWTVCQIQYNYMDEDCQAGTDGLKYAADKGFAVVVMEPLRGGQLSKSPPDEIMFLWQQANRKRSLADWALRWVWNHPEVSTVLSGMRSLEDVKRNIESANHSSIPTLSNKELKLISRVCDAYRQFKQIPCTQCRYCVPCPFNVDIPRIFEIFNDVLMYGHDDLARQLYFSLEEETKADQCTACGRCEELCPQKIAIIEWLRKAHEALSQYQRGMIF